MNYMEISPMTWVRILTPISLSEKIILPTHISFCLLSFLSPALRTFADPGIWAGIHNDAMSLNLDPEGFCLKKKKKKIFVLKFQFLRKTRTSQHSPILITSNTNLTFFFNLLHTVPQALTPSLHEVILSEVSIVN